MALLSLASLLSIYPAMMLVPIALLLAEGTAMKRRIVGKTFWNFVSYLGLWSACSWFLSDIPSPFPLRAESLQLVTDFVIYATPIGCNFFVADFRPNVGLAWYLFVEMFDHFRAFFLAVFQLNILVYLIPATFKFSSDPVLLAAFLTAVPSIFKPYPTLADSVLLVIFLSFVGLSLLKQSIILPLYVFAMLAFSLLGQINWHYWIQQGSGNANFYYAITLFYGASHILLVLDIVYRWIRRDVQRRNPNVDLASMYQY